MQLLTPLADYTKPGSPASILRRRRFARFIQLVERCRKQHLRILDIGGTESFWESMGFVESGHDIVLVNIFAQQTRHENITSIVGDARSLEEFDQGEFDIVFSNSVIEHLRSFEDQRKMAAEVQRLAQRYFVQTPNYYFPIEPHFLVPGFQYLPQRVRVWMLQRFKLGHYERVEDLQRARELVSEIRLLTKSELQSLFPDASIYHERVLGLTKSFLAIKH